ncbi:hypothetical protein ACH4SK_39045 [Streptomyces inhibens]|uniref:hypothetical protein n=1 Tax=Streptomyces inhibens TaxID=2293571 RepID=UPI0037BA1F5D
MPVLLGALLAAVEDALMESGNGGPESVAAVLRGYEAASSLVRKAGWATALHLRFARTAAEVERVLGSEIGYAATGAAHLASSVLRLEMVAGTRSIQKPRGGPVPSKEMFQSAKKLLAEVRSALDHEVRQELARADHRVWARSGPRRELRRRSRCGRRPDRTSHIKTISSATSFVTGQLLG